MKNFHSPRNFHSKYPNRPVNNSLFSPEFSTLNDPIPNDVSGLHQQMHVAQQAVNQNISIEQARYNERLERANIRRDNTYNFYQGFMHNSSPKKEQYAQLLEKTSNAPNILANIQSQSPTTKLPPLGKYITQ